jgi:hypothetical protein
MQAMLQLLHQYHLMHLQVHLLQAEKGLVFLQHPTEVGKMFRPGTGRARLSKKIMLDGISTDMTSIAFHAQLPKRASKGCQSFLPHDHGTLSAI